MKSLLLLSVALPTAFATSNLDHSSRSDPSGDALLQKVYQFPNNTWVENLAVRSNGNILVSLISSPEVWQINPEAQSAELVFAFPHATSAMGFAEVTEDVFIVSIGNFSYVTGAEQQGSWSVWELDFGHAPLPVDEGRGYWRRPHYGYEQDIARVRKVLDIPEAVFLNGATALPGSAETGIVLIADSELGTIWRVNTRVETYRVAAQDPAFRPNASIPLQIGINGMHYHEGYVYSSNTFSTPLLARTPVSPSGYATGPVEVISESAEFPVNGGAAADDFAIGAKGDIWLASASSTLVKIAAHGEQEVVAGGADSKVLLGCTSAAFGRATKMKDILYISTNGGLGNPALGVVGGGLYSLDTARL
ncbi:Putative hetero-Diels-Alderase asR5 [Fulvia fulva]|uniref:Hetero-Diels-Alderase asR5 n=1 Tax=Passalora fulva TaxID=5499 RepID=A0A9Q8P4I6_PASFU|nr:Putative hetero-Diels-Alderase asR5 [Fulvia fulva]KAK4635370.1 putative hetero-Diels-Alderase asR5 [Fulvia fulva]KAK4638177.1 putative hetero-Diels-Alderase asR5 [Fulvia fulva]UJO12782.1 Putative hetero-Diels-Alderase asR5 [Fulvia fulva]WPV09089.1 Putative hetero-Diels-Alderase asR5 [Fulvia fulva]WPV24245.1 Putative hetero-Diels-Alderase asR5 [Fulvia fulva]